MCLFSGRTLSRTEKNWVLIDSFDVDMEKEADIDKELLEAQKMADKHIAEEKLSRNTKLSKLQKIKKILLDDISASPDEVSELDWIVNGFYFITRYKYEETPSPKAKGDSREFCKEMMSADLLYRREDIDRMSADGVNSEFAPAGKNSYNILKWKGGSYCHHAFTSSVGIAWTLLLGRLCGTPHFRRHFGIKWESKMSLHVW